MSVFDWIIILCVFFDAYGNILRFLPILSGSPSEIEAAKEIKCFGKGVLGCATTMRKGGNAALFLRSLIGRSATVFHTVGSRHALLGLYVDAIVNELREEEVFVTIL